MFQVKMQKRYVTLIEVMIVMFLIALIAGVVAYNYRGSLDEGRAFETKQNIEKLRNILELELAKQTSSTYPSDINALKEIVRKSPLVKNADDLFLDGWKNPLKIEVSGTTIKIYSDNEFCTSNPGKCGPGATTNTNSPAGIGAP